MFSYKTYCRLFGLLILSGSVGFATEISTVAGTGKKEVNLQKGSAEKVNIGQTFGVEIGPQGNLYICEVENHRVLKLDFKTNQVETVAGTGKKGNSGDGGPATKAELFEPYEIRFDSKGDLYFVEMKNAIIRKVDLKTGMISKVAGIGEHGYGGDGDLATKATFKSPHSIAFDSQDNLYVADIGNHRIRKIDRKSGVITTILGNGKKKLPTEGLIEGSNSMIGPRALYIKDDVLWIALREGHSVWRYDLSTKKLAHVAGTGKKGYQDGDASKASFNGPKGIVVGNHQDVYVVDTENQTIRMIDLESKKVSTIAGTGPQGRNFSGDQGEATKATMDRPHGIALDAQGNVYIGDTNNHRVRKVKAVK